MLLGPPSHELRRDRNVDGIVGAGKLTPGQADGIRSGLPVRAAHAPLEVIDEAGVGIAVGRSELEGDVAQRIAEVARIPLCLG
jgi:hypothetical protein